ncbi:ferredoxin family protein [Paenibacillus thalictri]|uniref:Ferredoxin family protein n=1 Tax=Paenibacillus thalictri TaxID=2527873 RepID=A0A4Q9DKK2_9BACL|nr:ferredoxin family protein [Paenibacillus thalictri]
MIEMVSESRCIGCNMCVKVCPTNVFDRTERGVPVISRQSDCQTCFMCELYCPADALYVAPHAEVNVVVEEAELAQRNLLGQYRERVGWRI